jgi:hypothetical protein
VIPEGLDGIIAERRLVLLGSLAIGSGLSVDSIFARLGRFAALDVLSDVTVGGQPQKFARMLSSQVDDKPSSGTGATDAHTYQIPANTLQTDGDILIIHAGGTFTSNSNNKTWKLFFDGTAQLNVTNAAASATMWSIEAWVTRKSSSSAIVTARTARYNNAQAVFDNPAQFLDASVDYTAAIDIKTQVQMATSGTTTETYFSVIYVPAT